METLSYFPDATGTEEETRISIWQPSRDNVPATFVNFDGKQCSILNHGIDKFCPTLPSSSEFRENGSRTYVDAGGVELASPEVDNPVDQLIYTKATARLLEESLANYMSTESRSRDRELVGVFQRRVIDDKGNTWGCHDNFSIQQPGYVKLVPNEGAEIGRLWVGYLYSRGIISGAMHVGERGSTFSQKLSRDHSFDKYGYGNSLLRVDDAHGQRLEVRCNDVNLLDWAFLSRIGGTSLLLAASQTALGSKLVGSKLFQFDERERASWNTVPLDRNYDLYAAKGLKRAIDMQRYVFSTILENLESYTNEATPKIYRKIGKGILQFCDDLEAVANGKSDLDILTDRADWAAKLKIIREHIRRKPSKRRLGDAKSRMTDLMYDRISVRAQPDSEAITSYGYGHVLAADKSILRRYPNTIEVAMHCPPQRTRASVRVRAAKRLGDKVTGCDWHAITVNGSEEPIPLGGLRKATVQV
ncbi:MAG TPA: proteasome accessory factor PafA2 family protein [Candidatus Saccharimonadales bacterium]|jgi:hypothetical protein